MRSSESREIRVREIGERLGLEVAPQIVEHSLPGCTAGDRTEGNPSIEEGVRLETAMDLGTVPD